MSALGISGKTKVDAFIIGGGLAGIHLALAMIRKGMDPLVIDKTDIQSSSRVAAGIINPITGRRFALSWKYEELKSTFTEEYIYWEKQWSRPFFENIKIYRSVPDNILVNDLDARLNDLRYIDYCRKITDGEVEHLRTKVQFKNPGYVFDGYHLDTVSFLDQGIQFLKSRGRFVSSEFIAKNKALHKQQFAQENFITRKVIYCTGAEIIHNPLWKWVDMNPNKGEAVLLKAEGWTGNDIIKQNIFFVPQGEGKIWAGTYNSWEYEDRTPSSAAFTNLTEQVKELLTVPYTLLEHLSAIRPAVKDRRPVIGPHPENPHIILFNGFGSKGSSLIPFFARELTAFISEGIPLSPEVRADRFWKSRLKS